MITHIRLTVAANAAYISVIPDWDVIPKQKGGTKLDTEYLDSLDLEGLTGTKASTWRYWANENPPQGPPSFKIGRRRVWKRGDVERWLAEQEAPTTVNRD